MFEDADVHVTEHGDILLELVTKAATVLKRPTTMTPHPTHFVYFWQFDSLGTFQILF